jgi:hypothetical protein
MLIFGVIIFVTVFVFVVVKELMSYGKPYSKSLNTESAVEEKVVPKKQKKAEPQKAKPATKKTKKSKFEYKTYRVPGGYGYLLGGVGGGGAGNYSKQDDDFVLYLIVFCEKTWKFQKEFVSLRRERKRFPPAEMKE